MKLYAYCLSDEVTARMIESVEGLAGAKPYLIERGEISAVVSDFADERAAVTREHVTAHERVVRHVLSETTPLPFRFGTIISEERLLSYLDSQATSLKLQLERVRGCVEWSVKVSWNLEAVRQEALRDDDTALWSPVEAGSKSEGSGTAFLLAKRREILGEKVLRERAEEISSWLNGALSEVVREAQVNLQPRDSLVLAAAHLVERERLAEYRLALERARAEKKDLHFLTSGAWPPYSFTSAGS
jgi:hypothetical protein